MFLTKEDKPVKRKIATIEDTDRFNNWYRNFSVRSEAWPTIEHWAHEMNYHLTAMKGQKRVYTKGYDSQMYQTFVEFRQADGRVNVSAWIQVGSLLRWLTLFQLPEVLPIDPSGWKGIQTRRTACHDLNSLLIRFRQREIAGSDGWHWADLDLTSIVFFFFSLFTLGYFGVLSALRMEIRPNLSNGLLTIILEKVGYLGAFALVFMILHEGIVIKRLEKTWARWASMAGLSLFLTIGSIFFLFQSQSRIQELKTSHYCITQYDAKRCETLVQSMKPEEKDAMKKRLEVFQKHLTLRP